MQIQFLGAARTVTGSKHLITTADHKKILLDCGLFQDKGSENNTLNRNYDFNPAEIDYLILSHAHIDHSGNIPFLVKEGFKGPIYCTPATYDLCEVMLADSARIQEQDVYYVNKRRRRDGKPLYEPLYTEEDVAQALAQFMTVPYLEWTALDNNIKFQFTDAGHILGSAAVHLEIIEDGVAKKVSFTGDIGRPNDKLLPPPAFFPQADYLICESTYGDRLHSNMEHATQLLLDAVLNTCVHKKGKLIIPAFSLGRTQEVVYTFDRLVNTGLIPKIPVYVDSPLSVNATDIMRKHKHLFNDSLQDYMDHDPDPFGFSHLHYIREAQESKSLNYKNEPCVIISSSGMMEAGRIKHHLKNNISSKANTVLIVGYCTPRSLGGRLIAGEKVVRIFGEEYEVNADIRVIDSYSAHADYKEMLSYLSCQNKDKIKNIFLVHGDTGAQQAFKQRLIEAGYPKVHIPHHGEKVEI